MTGALWLALGAALGAPMRYVVDLVVQSRHDSLFPWGTFVVNVVGSLVLGVAAGATASGVDGEWLRFGVGIGLCGALTTFSTFGYETVRLLEDGSGREAWVNVVASVVVGLAAAAAGFAAAAAWV